MINIQYLGSGEDIRINVVEQCLLFKIFDYRVIVDVYINVNDSIVIESWDFVDGFGDIDDENVFQSVFEDFEKFQQVFISIVRRVLYLYIKFDMFYIIGI